MTTNSTTVKSDEVKHTPGPFAVMPDSERAGLHPNHAVRFVCTADFDEDAGTGQVLAKLTDSPEIVGNGCLFAAAPDLLEACKADDQIEILNDSLRENYARLRDADRQTVEYKRIAEQNVADIRAQLRAIKERRRAAIAKAEGKVL